MHFHRIPFVDWFRPRTKCDEGIALRQYLPGKRWDEVSTEFVDYNSGSLPLLEPSAPAAFLPAWLMRAVETLSDKSVLAEFTMYFLCRGSEDDGWDGSGIAARIGLFDGAQRNVVSDFLRSIMEREELPYWYPYAEHGLKWWAGFDQTT